eukprot:CAMPEP_0203642952 /NCGR_PEP_ID=MMETSP0088-20131115/8363_1 /ASSEMBLY_ACC=CAM_ASM_001087 /TAXON_ID=426623 /ORGANISM="Chaetoceros affinis, Strain CCMP159" /LENGTH=501 /DNA_ID=CAMNT_0050498951 /DNA_START=30 /DNA_END=1535 /DNA_ORIENTATION=+
MTSPPPPSKNKNRKPGLTAKGDRRQYVQHSYSDRSNDVIQNLTTSDENTLRLYKEDSVGGPFPIKLHIVLKVTEKLGQQHIISWLPHGRSFMIHRPREFEEEVMGKFFKQTKLTSFRRQLNLYDFQRITHGRDAGSYYHELFLRGRPLLAKRMIRRKVKGTKIRASSSPDDEPNFYTMTFMGPITDFPSKGPVPSMDHRQDQLLNPMSGGNHPGSMSMQGRQGQENTTTDGSGSRQFDTSSLQHGGLGAGSLQNPLHQNANANAALYSDLMRSSALNQMQYPSHYGAPMDNLDYLALSTLHRQRLASAAYPSYLHSDAALLDSMARLQAAGMDPNLSRYNESLLRASQLGSGMGAGCFPNAHGGAGAANLSSMLLNQQRGFDPISNPSPATRLLLEQMNLQQHQASQMNPSCRQSTSQSLDEKQNAIEQLLLLQKDRSGAGTGAGMGVGPGPAAPTLSTNSTSTEASSVQVPPATPEEQAQEEKITTAVSNEAEKSTVLAL